MAYVQPGAWVAILTAVGWFSYPWYQGTGFSRATPLSSIWHPDRSAAKQAQWRDLEFRAKATQEVS